MTPAMAKTIVVHRLAETELMSAYRWYRERSDKAGGRFLAEIDRAMGAIADRPQSFPEYLKKTRRCLLTRFPFLLVFREFDREIPITAVAQGRRRPGYWRSRV
jgi:hypothetical protein